MKLAKAILFDLDDTILAYSDATDIALKKVCVEFAAKYEHLFDAEELLKTYRKVAAEYWSDTERHRLGRLNMIEARRTVMSSAFDDLGIKNINLSQEMADTFTQWQYDFIEPFPGAIETLEALAKMNVRMILVTNGSTLFQWAKIKRFKLERFFEECLVEGDLGFGKPDIRVFQLAIKKLHIGVEKIWIVGDNLKWDIQIPNMLGIYTVWNDYRQQGLPANSPIQPKRIIHHIRELL